MPKKSNSFPRQFKVGDKIRFKVHSGKIFDATIIAIFDTTRGLRYQIDFGVPHTALIREWQIVQD
ncbi:MAG: hypothetical protein WBR14_23480 [Candidatus Acidiferrum sp.]